MQAAIDKRASIEHALHNAIEENQFQLYYQKQVDDKGAVVGSEALIRWKSPSLGLVLPGDFIPLAEDSGLILSVGRWVINAACEQIQSCREQGLGDEVSVAVNISPKQFYHPQFIDDILECLKRTGVDARRLKFEVTESLVIRDIDAAVDIMRKLKRLGVRFSMDDFGTGYSSLEYLSKLPLSELKIDQSFVHNMHINARPTIIIKTIISMAKSLGLTVVAEGVETQIQYQLLQSFGCQIFQGYHFGRPMPAADCEDFLS
jgi:EAL domain-containing protein (putative c-di-GMP-specific phosphodiesterase class I)